MKKLSIDSAALTGRTPKPSKARLRGNRASRVPEIIEASIRVLLTAGYAGYSITQVASESGILLSTLQHYFPSRVLLLTATIREFAGRELERRWEVANNVLLSPHQRLDAIVDMFVADFTAPDTGRFVVEVWALSEHEEFAAEFVDGIATQYREIFEKIILEASPAMPADERSIRAAMITVHAHGLVVYLRHSGRDAPELVSLIRGTKAVWRALAF